MTTVQTKTPINWGGANPTIDNKIRVSITEISRDANGITYNIIDTPLIEHTLDGQTFETSHIPIRNKTITITPEQHDTLYGNADLYINSMYPTTTLFEREKLRPKIALLLYIQNDKLSNGKCIYNTESDQWE